jgi:hypothetical protein
MELVAYMEPPQFMAFYIRKETAPPGAVNEGDYYLLAVLLLGIHRAFPA